MKRQQLSPNKIMADKNKLTDTQKADQMRRTKLAMMYLLMEEYPREAKEKTRKFGQDKPRKDTRSDSYL
jgi:hypothetical protein